MTPQRIQRRRVKGWKMPEGAIYVGRPTKWGNPFRRGEGDDPQWAVSDYEQWLMEETAGDKIRLAATRELRGHDLCCWCKPGAPCHADVLLRIANEGNAPKPLDADAAP